MAGRLWYLGTVPLCMSSKSDFTDEPGAPERWCVWMYGGIGTGVCVSLFEISHPLQFIIFLSFTHLFFVCQQTLGKSLHVSGLGFSVRIEEGLGFLLETFLKPSEVLFPRFVLFPNVGLVLPFSAVQNLSFGSCLLRLSRLKRRPGFPIDSSEVLRRGWPIRFVSPCLLANICVLGSFYLK